MQQSVPCGVAEGFRGAVGRGSGGGSSIVCHFSLISGSLRIVEKGV